MVVLILLLTASRRALDSPDRMGRRMSKRRGLLEPRELLDAREGRVCRSGPRSSSRRASAPTRRSWARARSTMRPAARSHACTRSCVSPRHHRDGHPVLHAIDPLGRVLQQEPGAADVEMPPAAHVFCQVVIGQCGVSFPSEKAVGFSPVRNWPVIARVLLFHCIRA